MGAFEKNNVNAFKQKKKKKNKKMCKQFDVITNKNGESITQTLSGRIVKIHHNKQYYDNLDKLLDVASEHESEDSDTTNSVNDNQMPPPTKKRKLSPQKTKYQYPFLIKSSLPEPDENDDGNLNKLTLEARNAYTQISKIKTTKSSQQYQYKYSHHSISASNKYPKHINRGFACIIEQIERKRKRQIDTF